MKNHRFFLKWICFLLGLLVADLATAAMTATATVTFTINAISAIAVSGNPGALTISSAIAGSEPTSVTNSSTTYAVATNQSSMKVTGSIDSNMPTGTTLSVSLTAPSGGTSAGAVSLTTSTQNLVTGITKVAQAGMGITYTLAATVSAAVAGPLTRTVTYTITP